MFYRVQEVIPLKECELLVTFMNGEKRKYNVKPLLEKWKEFQVLISVDGLFEQVKVDTDGYGVSWNNNIDLSCNELYENGIRV